VRATAALTREIGPCRFPGRTLARSSEVVAPRIALHQAPLVHRFAGRTVRPYSAAHGPAFRAGGAETTFYPHSGIAGLGPSERAPKLLCANERFTPSAFPYAIVGMTTNWLSRDAFSATAYQQYNGGLRSIYLSGCDDPARPVPSIRRKGRWWGAHYVARNASLNTAGYLCENPGGECDLLRGAAWRSRSISPLRRPVHAEFAATLARGSAPGVVKK